MNTHNAFCDNADQWWDVNGPYWTLHAINPIRLSYIYQYIHSGKALDIGCGGGILSESLAESFEVLGIDTDKNLIAIAKEQGNAQYEHTTSSQIKTSHSEHFDLITCLEVLEHVDTPKLIIEDIAAMLKPNGYVFISTLNRNLFSFLGAIVMAEHVLKLLPKHTHHYEHFIQPKELIQWAEASGLTLIDIQGIGYNPFDQSFDLCNHSLINYIVCFEKR